MSLLNQPDILFHEIFTYLDVHDLYNYRILCRDTYQIFRGTFEKLSENKESYEFVAKIDNVKLLSYLLDRNGIPKKTTIADIAKWKRNNKGPFIGEAVIVSNECILELLLKNNALKCLQLIFGKSEYYKPEINTIARVVKEDNFDIMKIIKSTNTEQLYKHLATKILMMVFIKSYSYINPASTQVEISEEKAVNIPGYISNLNNDLPLENVSRNILDTFYKYGYITKQTINIPEYIRNLKNKVGIDIEILKSETIEHCRQFVLSTEDKLNEMFASKTTEQSGNYIVESLYDLISFYFDM